jgi:hypothetical protein
LQAHCCSIKYIVTYSGYSIHDGTLLHPKIQYTTVKHSQKLFEHTYTSDPHGLGTLTPIEFFQQDLLWLTSNTHSHSCSQKASKHTLGQSIVGLSVHLHSTTAPRRIHHKPAISQPRRSDVFTVHRIDSRASLTVSPTQLHPTDLQTRLPKSIEARRQRSRYYGTQLQLVYIVS